MDMNETSAMTEASGLKLYTNEQDGNAHSLRLSRLRRTLRHSGPSGCAR